MQDFSMGCAVGATFTYIFYPSEFGYWWTLAWWAVFSLTYVWGR